jgi:hypothetical protein
MHRITKIVLIASFLFGCAVQKERTSGPETLSSKYYETDSVTIQLTYRDLTSCIDDQTYQRISLYIMHGKSFLLHHDTTMRKIGPIEGSILNEVVAFEENAKNQRGCGGYGGGHGVLVTMLINGTETEFGYCKDDWDGIGHAIEERMKNLPQTALVPLPTPVEAMNPSSRNKITKGGLRQAQAR